MITVLYVYIYMHKKVVIISGLIEDQVKEYIFEVDDLSAVVDVHVDGSSAVVGLEKGVLKCFSCCVPKACCHVVYMSLLLDDKEQLEKYELQGLHNIIQGLISKRFEYRSKPADLTTGVVSSKAINLIPSKKSKYLSPSNSEDSLIHLIPPPSVCPRQCSTELIPVVDGIYPLLQWILLKELKV